MAYCVSAGEASAYSCGSYYKKQTCYQSGMELGPQSSGSPLVDKAMNGRYYPGVAPLPENYTCSDNNTYVYWVDWDPKVNDDSDLGDIETTTAIHGDAALLSRGDLDKSECMFAMYQSFISKFGVVPKVVFMDCSFMGVDSCVFIIVTFKYIH